MKSFRPVRIICSESPKQILIHMHVPLMPPTLLTRPLFPRLSLGVKRERQTGPGGGVTTVKDKEQSLLVKAEGVRGLGGALLITQVFPAFMTGPAEAAKHQEPSPVSTGLNSAYCCRGTGCCSLAFSPHVYLFLLLLFRSPKHALHHF